MRNKTEFNKIKIGLEQKYAKSLFDKRIEVYPELYNLLSSYAKLIGYNQQTIDNLIEFRDNIDKWNNKYSIFFTASTSTISARFRGYLRKLLSDGTKSRVTIEDWKAIGKILFHFEQLLRAEIGILDTKPVGEPKDIKNVYEFIEEKRTVKRGNQVHIEVE